MKANDYKVYMIYVKADIYDMLPLQVHSEYEIEDYWLYGFTTDKDVMKEFIKIRRSDCVKVEKVKMDRSEYNNFMYEFDKQAIGTYKLFCGDYEVHEIITPMTKSEYLAVEDNSIIFLQEDIWKKVFDFDYRLLKDKHFEVLDKFNYIEIYKSLDDGSVQYMTYLDNAEINTFNIFVNLFSPILYNIG